MSSSGASRRRQGILRSDYCTNKARAAFVALLRIAIAASANGKLTLGSGCIFRGGVCSVIPLGAFRERQSTVD